MTAELSLSPLRDDYIPVIDGFIADGAQRESLTVVSHPMSTRVAGEFEAVFAAVQSVLARRVEAFGRQVLVCKCIADDLQ